MQDDAESTQQKPKDKNNISLGTITNNLVAGDVEAPKNSKKKFSFKDLTKKQKIILVVSLIVTLLVGGFSVWYFFLKQDPPAPAPTAITQTPEDPPKTTEPSKLTGLEVKPEINDRTVTGIMIENSPDARPQAGLRDAGVVYEAIAEGGITRFLALFQDEVPEYVGPVRSVRPYYLDFLVPYDAGVAHVGGSGKALGQIKSQGIKDLDQFSNSGAFWRESKRYAPHNMYTNVKKLKTIEKQKGWKASDYQSLERGEESQPVAKITAKDISVKISSTNYNVKYEYDKKTNTYLRFVGNRPHKDDKSNKQLAPSVVIVPIIKRSQDGIYSVYQVNGEGKVYVFQNGTVTIGKWKKKNRKDQFKFVNENGKTLKLAPGQTWFTITAMSSNVSYTP
jgi:hypothetical protein